jgi:two-component system sensor histidine kinase KdpD
MQKALIGHTVHVHIAETVPMLMLDFVLTEQIIANLLDNAAKYSAPGTSIEIAVTDLAGEVQVQVRDEGTGVAPEDAERIFERFFRVESADRRPAGTGLGLAICRGFVEAMGGAIGVANRTPGPGAEFTVRFSNQAVGADTVSAGVRRVSVAIRVC